MQISQVSSDLRESTFPITSAKTAFFFPPLEIDFSVTLFRPMGKCYLLKGPSLTTLPKLLLCHSLAHNLEKAMAPHSSTFAWTIPWTEEPGRLQSMGSLRVRHDYLHFHLSLSCTGEGNGNPLQCSCLENPRDGGAWWAAIYGVARSWTRLKRHSSSSSP